MAKGSNTETRVLPLVLPIVEEMGLELVDLEFVKEGANWYLRIYIDKENGVDINDCEAVSKAVEAKLDAEDPIEQAYVLEVSSPGLDRPLKKEEDFARFAGEIIDVKLYQAMNGKKTLEGKLIGLEYGVIVMEEDGKEVRISRKDAAYVRLAVIF